MRYEHTQRGYLHFLLFGLAAMFAVVAWGVRAEPGMPVIFLVAAALMLGLGLYMAELTIRDEETALAVCFGPLPLFRRRVRYSDITGVEVGRSSVLDGWGIHYLFGRGWTWNVHGFGCVVLDLSGRTLRLGTDEPEALAAFLRSRIEGEAR